MSQLPLYQCHKKVRAAKILAIITTADPEGASLILEGIGNKGIQVDSAWLTRNPAVAVGGYFVEYQEGDRYTAYSPAGPFEAGYTLIGGPVFLNEDFQPVKG